MRALKGALCWLGVILTDLVGGGVPVTTSGAGLFAAVKPEDPPPAGACTMTAFQVEWKKDERAQDERRMVTSMRLERRWKLCDIRLDSAVTEVAQKPVMVGGALIIRSINSRSSGLDVFGVIEFYCL